VLDAAVRARPAQQLVHDHRQREEHIPEAEGSEGGEDERRRRERAEIRLPEQGDVGVLAQPRKEGRRAHLDALARAGACDCACDSGRAQTRATGACASTQREKGQRYQLRQLEARLR